MKNKVEIREAIHSDFDSIRKNIKQVIATGDILIFNPDPDKKKILDYCCGEKNTYEAVKEDKKMGTFILKDNLPDLGSHVVNASCMTLNEVAGEGWNFFIVRLKQHLSN